MALPMDFHVFTHQKNMMFDKSNDLFLYFVDKKWYSPLRLRPSIFATSFFYIDLFLYSSEPWGSCWHPFVSMLVALGALLAQRWSFLTPFRILSRNPEGIAIAYFH